MRRLAEPDGPIAGPGLSRARQRLVDHHSAAKDKDPLQLAHPGRAHVTAACGEGGWKSGRRSRSPMAFEPFNGGWKPAVPADLGLPKTRLER
jgi:hypothetical protein